MNTITRQEAKKLALKYYFTGKPCLYGSVSERSVSNGDCQCQVCKENRCNRSKIVRESQPEKVSKLKSDWKKANPEKVKAYNTKYRKENRDKVKKLNKINKKAYIERFPEREVARRNNWKTKNPGLVSLYKKNRRARKLNAQPIWFGELDNFVLLCAEEACKRREKMHGMPFHIDHMIPLQGEFVSGLHCYENIQVIPAHLNLSKCNKLIYTEPNEWIFEM